MDYSVHELNADTWMSDVEQSIGIMVVYFWAPWCGHCKCLLLFTLRLPQRWPAKCVFAKLNCDEHSSTAIQCKVTGTPTVVVYINGKRADRIVGSLSKDALIDRISLRLGKEAV